MSLKSSNMKLKVLERQIGFAKAIKLYERSISHNSDKDNAFEQLESMLPMLNQFTKRLKAAKLRFHIEIFEKYLYFRKKSTFLRTRYRQNQHLWRHFGVCAEISCCESAGQSSLVKGWPPGQNGT